MRFLLVPLSILLVSFITSCSSLEVLKTKVDRSTYAAITYTDHQGAKNIAGDLKIQRENRDLYLAEVDQCLREYPNDSVSMIEYYTGGCLSCPADRIEIFAIHKVIVYKRSSIDGRYTKVITKYADREILVASVTAPAGSLFHNNQKPKFPTILQLSYNKCANNGHQIYTLFTPNSKVQSIYLNCLSYIVE